MSAEAAKSEAEPLPETFRWAVFFRDLAEPLFVLNARQRLLFVNSAWERLTGFTLAQVRGQRCRRRAAEIAPDRLPQLLTVLAPPALVRSGRPAEARRRLPLAGGQAWAMVDFFPMLNAQGLQGILGKVRVLTAAEQVTAQPLPEKLLALHDQITAAHALERWPATSPEMERLQDQV